MARQVGTLLTGTLMPRFAPDPTAVQKCLETGKTAKSFEYGKCLGYTSHGYTSHETFEYGKCLETGKCQNPL